MTARTYRVQVTGQFAGLIPAQKNELRYRQAEHDVLVSAFTSTGTLTYTPSLTRFTLRYLLEVEETSAAEADAVALIEGELLAAHYLESHGLAHRSLTTSAVCLQDVKVRRHR